MAPSLTVASHPGLLYLFMAVCLYILNTHPQMNPIVLCSLSQTVTADARS